VTPLTDAERLLAAFEVVRDIHENPERAEHFASGTSFTPIGIEDGRLDVAVKPPGEPTNTQMEVLLSRGR
jgi:hypothetical protein